MSGHFVLSHDVADWLAQVADDIDTGVEPPANILPQLATGGLIGVGVPYAHGGTGGDVTDAVAAVASVAEISLASSFVLWGQRTYVEYLLQSSNGELRERSLADQVSGSLAGATGLSNAMKFLAGLEALQIVARADGNTLVLEGKLPWVTNLRPEGFHVAAAVDRADGRSAFIVSLVHDDDGLLRSQDLDLIAMRSSNTAALTISNVRIGPDRIIAENAAEWLPRVRPAFLGLQCGMSLGLARRALSEATSAGGAGRGVLGEPTLDLKLRLDRAENRLFSGLRSRQFETDAASLFGLRIEFADLVNEAVFLELQAFGGKAYLMGPGNGFARRWREAAFIPVITPSIVQLKTVLRGMQVAA